MRPYLLAIPVSLFLVTPHAGAQAQDYPLITGTQTVEVTAPPPGVFVSPDQADAIKGAYAMSNGWRLKVSTARRGIVAQIDNQRPMRLMAVSGDKFVSADGNTTMEFNRGDRGEDMLMSYVPASSTLAGMVPTRVTIAAR